MRQHISRVKWVTGVGLVANLALTAAKLIAGYWSASQALVADGVHSLSDCITDVVIYVGV